MLLKMTNCIIFGIGVWWVLEGRAFIVTSKDFLDPIAILILVGG